MALKRESNVDPDLSVMLDRIVRRVTPKLPQLAASIADDYAAEFEEYARLLPEAREQIIQSSFANLRVLVGELAPESTSVPAYDPAVFERTGAVRMRMGVSIDTLMRSFNVWAQRAWEFFRSEVDLVDQAEMRALLAISDQILAHVERATASMAKGYMREATATWTDREMTRFAVLEALVAGRVDVEELQHTGNQVNLATAYTPICFERRLSQEPTVRSTNDYVREIGRIVTPAGPPGKVLVGSHHGSPFVLWPAGVNAAHLAGVVRELSQGFPELAIGTGRESKGLDDVAVVFSEARQASKIAVALDSSEPLHFAELRLELAIAGSAELRALSNDVLAPLDDYDRRKDAGLIETLNAYIASGCNVAEAAKVTFIHPNTVIYRLKRVAEVSGYDPRDARGLLILSIAMLSIRLVGSD